MSFSSLANNQAVTFTDMQSSGVPLNSGQSAITSTQCMRKSDLITMYAVNTSSATLSPKASNQLIVKQDVTASATTTTVTIQVAYGVTITGLNGLGIVPSGTLPVNSGSKSYTVSTSIPAGTVSVTTGAAPVTTAHISLYVNNSQVSCVNISAAGFYQLTLNSSIAVGSTVLLSVGGGVC